MMSQQRLHEMREIKRKIFLLESNTGSDASDTLTSIVIQSPLDSSGEHTDQIYQGARNLSGPT